MNRKIAPCPGRAFARGPRLLGLNDRTAPDKVCIRLDRTRIHLLRSGARA